MKRRADLSEVNLKSCRMASAGDPTRKGTSDSNVDDVNDQEEKMIQSLKDNPASVVTLSKLLSCDACNSLARAPIRYCGKCHAICSVCYKLDGAKCPAKDCKEKLMPKTLVNAKLTETIRDMKLLVQCRNRKNGCPEKGEEKEMEEHEIECEFRCVGGHNGFMFKYVKRYHEIVKQSDGKWKLSCYGNPKVSTLATRSSLEPDGHFFRIHLDITTEKSVFKAYAIVIGGERVAKKYRVELRLNSSEKEFTNTHHGPVFSVDVEKPWEREEAYRIDKKMFALYNKGFDYFGAHNKDKNGEITVPITVRIIKKELDIPKEDGSGTPADMDDEEK